MENLVSIIVPIYNKSSTIDRCVQSLLNQSYSILEIILVNDGSIDDSEKKCSKYMNDVRVKYIAKKNGGVSSARNKGLEIARGEFIIFVDADDSVESNFVEYLLKEMVKGFDLAVCGKINHYWNNQKIKCGFVIREVQEIKELDSQFIKLFQSDFFNSSVSKIYRKDMIHEYFDENLSYGEDLSFVLNYLKGISKVSILPDCLYNYYIQKNSLTTKLFDNEFQIIKQLNTTFNEFYKSCLDGNNQFIIQTYSCNSIIMLIQKMFQNGHAKKEEIRYILNDTWTIQLIKNEKNIHSLEWKIIKTKQYILIKIFFLVKLILKKWMGRA